MPQITRLKKLLRLMLVYTILVVFGSPDAYAIDQKNSNELMNIIDTICGQFSERGSARELELSGDAEVSFKGIIKRLFSLGLSGGLELDESEYIGVLRKHLASNNQSIRECRLELWKLYRNGLTVQNLTVGPDKALNSEQQFYSRYSFNSPPFIHPRIVQDLIGWISDTGYQIDAINLVDSQQSNRYSGEFEARHADDKEGPPWVIWFDGVDNGKYGFGRTPFITYKYLGRTKSGLEVIHAKDSGGGSAIFNWVLLLTVKADYGFKFSTLKQNTNGQLMANPEIQRRELVRVVGRFGLGDRWEGNIDVVGNDIVVSGRTLEEQCLEGGTIHFKDAFELSFFWDMECKGGIPESPPETKVYMVPSRPL